MTHLNTKFGHLFVLLALLTAFSGLVSGQKTHRTVADTKVNSAQPEASVTPVVIDSNIKCSDLNASTDTRFSHIINDYELKLNFTDPNGTFAFATGTGVVITGPQFPAKSIFISSASNSTSAGSTATVFEWGSQIPITAVIVKVGVTSYIYPYKPFAQHDTNLSTLDPQGISHVSFCYADPIAPTAANTSISGRVVTANGTGISGARLTIIDGATGESTAAITSPFGYYVIDNIQAGKLYILHVNHKRYTFAQPLRTMTLDESLVGIDFVANQ